MVLEVGHALLAVFSLGYLLLFSIVPNASVCIGDCKLLSNQDLIPFLIFKGGTFAILFSFILASFIQKLLKKKKISVVILTVVIYLLFLAVTFSLHYRQFTSDYTTLYY